MFGVRMSGIDVGHKPDIVVSLLVVLGEYLDLRVEKVKRAKPGEKDRETIQFFCSQGCCRISSVRA